MSTITIVAPSRSLEQRMVALGEANRIRSQRAVLKRDLKRGTAVAVEVLASPPGYANSMKVIDLLLAAPKVGSVKAGKWLRQAGVSHSKSLAGLSGRQRGELVALLGGRR